ncbi:MAG: T9SS type A sorting domain-containing protein [Cryomorphaceae bacterium]|nr:T9SS type A sorting domain-containing protein [Flavobacteriales bacterium]
MIIRLLSIASILVISLNVQGQFSVLFVDDTDDNFENAERFFESIEDAGYSPVYYDAVEEGDSPTVQYMAEFDLVVWHTAGDGAGLYFWNGDDSDNEDLMGYLDGGGKLWVVGLDFLFDRYGSAPVTFGPGDFAYDYLGLESHDAQAQADDGGIGAPSVVPDENSPVPDLDTLTWEFETLWWVDGVTPREDVAPVFRMAGEDYPLNDAICGTYRVGQGYITLAYYFDMSVTETDDMRLENVIATMAFLEGISLSNSDTESPAFDVQIYPNPNRGSFNLELDLPQTTSLAARLTDAQGRQIKHLFSRQQVTGGKSVFQFDSGLQLSPGLYFVQIISDRHAKGFPVVIE